MRKILITGACGFVAQYMIRHILQQEPDAEISGIDIAPACPQGTPGFRYRQLDLNNREATAALLAELAPDWIIHLAAASSVSASWQQPAETFLNNLIFDNIRRYDLSFVGRYKSLGLFVLGIGSKRGQQHQGRGHYG